MELSNKTLKKILLILTFGLVLYWALFHSATVGKLVSSFFSLISPFLIGFCIAFVINVLLRPLERLWDRVWKKAKTKAPDKLRRPICLLLSILLVLGAIFMIFFIIVPEVETSVSNFAEMLPQYVSHADAWWTDLCALADARGIELPNISLDTNKLVKTVEDYITQRGQDVVDTTFSFTASIFAAVVNFVLALAFSIYVLAQKEKLTAQVKKLLRAILPQKVYDRTLEICSLTNKTFTNFVTGQVTEAIIIGFLCFLGMLIFNMPYAPAISVLVGFTALIPVFGAFIGTGIGAFLILLVEPIQAIWFVVFIIVLQQIEGNLIYPKVVGKSVGLPGIWVLAAVTIGGNAFGVVGMLLSVPLCSVLYELTRQAVNGKLDKTAPAAGEAAPRRGDAPARRGGNSR